MQAIIEKKLSHPFINSNPKWSRKCMHPRPAVKGWIFLLKLMITFKSAGSTYFTIKKSFFERRCLSYYHGPFIKIHHHAISSKRRRFSYVWVKKRIRTTTTRCQVWFVYCSRPLQFTIYKCYLPLTINELLYFRVGPCILNQNSDFILSFTYLSWIVWI